MNKAFAQLTDLFRSMTPGARITAGLLLAVVVISVAYMFNSGFSGPDTYLLGGKDFSGEEMQAIQVAFGEAGLNNWDTDGMRIRIPRGQQDVYLAAMAKGNALPQEFGNDFKEMLKSDNMFTSDRRWDAERAIVQASRLANIISAMDGVDRATVDLHEDKARGMNRSPKRTAAVMAWPIGSHEITADHAKAFRELVCGACGIEQRNVSIINGKTKQTIAALGSETTGGAGNELFAAKKAYEQSYRDRALEALSFVRGVVVTSEVSVSPEAGSTSETLKVEPKTVPMRTSEQTSDSTSNTGGPGGQPGFEANSPVPNGQTAVSVANTRQSSQTDTTSRTETDMAVPHTTTKTETAGFVAQQVSVAVSVPEDHFIAVWRARNPVPEGQTATPPAQTDLDPIIATETDKIKKTVAALLPKLADGLPALDAVTVNPFTALPAEPAPTASFFEAGLGWLSQSWSTVALFMLAAFGLMTLRGLTRGIPVADASTSSAAGAPGLAIAPETTDEHGAPAEPGAKAAPAGPKLKRRGVGGPSLREELSEIVREDPDAAANVLRAWIGNAS